MIRSPNLPLAVLALLLALCAAGCGRAGPLEPPPGSAQAAQANKDSDASQRDSSLPQVHHRPKAIQPPKQPFFLDFLL